MIATVFLFLHLPMDDCHLKTKVSEMPQEQGILPNVKMPPQNLFFVK